MKKILLLLSMLSFITYAVEPNLDAMAFTAKHSFDKNLVKNIKFIQGEHFPLGENHTAYSMFFHATVNGVRQNIKVNCKENKITGNIDYCKPVSMEKVR